MEDLDLDNGDMARENLTKISPTEAAGSEEGEKVHKKKTMLNANHEPELVLFLQESNYQFVKDIFMDTEVIPWQQRYMLKCSRLERETISSMNEVEWQVQKSASKELALENKKEDEEEFGERYDRLIERSTKIPARQRFREVGTKETVTGIAMGLSSPESVDDASHIGEVSSSSEEEKEGGSSIQHCESSLTSISILEEFPQIPDCQKRFFKAEDRMSGSLTGPSFFNLNPPANGESGSFRVGPILGPITLSGQIPCSGSISLRSTSSNASSHSFAFPILTSEWNGSPVRMVKADQKQLRKQQRWRMCFPCCGF